MYDAKNEDLIVLHEIHNPVSPENNLPKVLAIELGNDASDVRSLEECCGRLNNTIDEGYCMKDRIAGDEVFNFLKICTGSQRPADLRHPAILSFNS